jgi:hypothetical protein
MEDRISVSGKRTPGRAKAPLGEERSLRLSFESFGWEALDALATRGGSSVEEYLASASRTYVQDLDNLRGAGDPGNVSLAPPRFKVSKGEGRELRITLPPTAWKTLQNYQGATVEKLVEHAAIRRLAAEPAIAEPRAEPQRPASIDDGRRAAAPSVAKPASRRRVPALVAAGALSLLAIPVVLAVAGVRVPEPARAPFEALGIELPHQTDDPAQPADGEPARPSDKGAADGGGADRSQQRPEDANNGAKGDSGRRQGGGGSDDRGGGGGSTLPAPPPVDPGGDSPTIPDQLTPGGNDRQGGGNGPLDRVRNLLQQLRNPDD